MIGGLVCERRNSESTGPKPVDGPLKLEPPETEGHESGFEDYPYEYSNERVTFSKNRFEYSDSPGACVGHGSFGTVFKGFDKSTSKEVAIKKMTTFNVKPNELKTMQRVSSDFLVALIEISDEKTGFTHVVMELCDTDLEQHLLWNTTSGRLVQSELKTLIDNVARGYYALYEHHIVHRDIKPQNILIIYEPSSRLIKKAKITDFGVSRVLSDAEDSKSLSNVAGTLYYMAPEVGANLLTICEYDHCVDMWSVGCVIYQSYIGKIPFDERALCRLFLHCAGGNYEAYDPPELTEDAPTHLQDLLNSLLEIDREKRATPDQLFEYIQSQN
ncbi:hypothetical protein FO519_002878 [Halicephalobus sp. NKZ332]|nr:hypothetical protein FO519_002878 [Halicephalobus sp. NKZ332]